MNILKLTQEVMGKDMELVQQWVMGGEKISGKPESLFKFWDVKLQFQHEHLTEED